MSETNMLIIDADKLFDDLMAPEEGKPESAGELEKANARVKELERELAEAKGEIDALTFAAHMPPDYPYGLPSWICQRLYRTYIAQGKNKEHWDALKSALDERDKLKVALEQVEWVDDDTVVLKYCPWCRNWERDGHKPTCARQSALSGEPSSPWRSIKTAPKDGSAILLLSAAYDDAYLDRTIHHPAKVAMGYWWPEGSSWVPQGPHKEDEIYTLQQTGVWSSGGGWFQPDEVTHWMPLPNATIRPDAAKEETK